ncbi:MAG: nucleotidyltransferase domain-containing protein [Nanoarchaeota archaeon]|nr:nucleotidyltransferase domain-containing protein [Nanoarchaeota archaeon]
MKTTSHIWNNETAFKLVEVFLKNPTKEMYESEVRKMSGLSLGSANKYMKEIVKEDVVARTKRGKMNFYRLNRDSQIVKQIKKTYSLSLDMVKELILVGKNLSMKIYLFGSVARGEDTEDSDWDLLIISDKDINSVEPGIFRIKRKFGANLKYLMFKQSDWIKVSKNDPAFYERVEKDKIELI